MHVVALRLFWYFVELALTCV